MSVKAKTTRCTVDNGGCDHLCFAYDEYGLVECACHDGYNLQSNLKSCKQNCIIDYDLPTVNGTIANNNYGIGDYDHNQQCEWSFYKYPPGYAVVFDNFTINLEHSPSCVNDYLLIGSTSIYCGFAVVSTPLQFDSNAATVTFKSNGNVTRSGFRFNFRILSPTDRQCEQNNGGCSSKCNVVNGAIACSCFSDMFELGADGATCEYVTSSTTTTTVTTKTTTTTTITTSTTTDDGNCQEQREVTRLNGIRILPQSTQYVPVNECVDLLSDTLFFVFSIAEFNDDTGECTRSVLYKSVSPCISNVCSAMFGSTIVTFVASISNPTS